MDSPQPVAIHDVNDESREIPDHEAPRIFDKQRLMRMIEALLFAAAEPLDEKNNQRQDSARVRS